jgi:hypothetical protein
MKTISVALTLGLALLGNASPTNHVLEECLAVDAPVLGARSETSRNRGLSKRTDEVTFEILFIECAADPTAVSVPFGFVYN